MKRDFLKSLGIEDKETIDKIMDENSADIGRAKGELQTYKDKVVELEGTIRDKDSEIATLTGKVGDADALRQEVAQLKTDKDDLTQQLSTKISEIQKNHAIGTAILKSGARHDKAVLALLDMSKITYENDELSGLTEQLEALQTGEDTSYLFSGSTHTAPSGTTPGSAGNNGGTDTKPKSFVDAVAKALNTQK